MQSRPSRLTGFPRARYGIYIYIYMMYIHIGGISRTAISDDKFPEGDAMYAWELVSQCISRQVMLEVVSVMEVGIALRK